VHIRNTHQYCRQWPGRSDVRSSQSRSLGIFDRNMLGVVCLGEFLLSGLHCTSACCPASPFFFWFGVSAKKMSSANASACGAEAYSRLLPGPCTTSPDLIIRKVVSDGRHASMILPDGKGSGTIRQPQSPVSGHHNFEIGTTSVAQPIKMRRPATCGHEHPGNKARLLAQSQQLRWWLQ
jgi:hypothetical protein